MPKHTEKTFINNVFQSAQESQLKQIDPKASVLHKATHTKLCCLSHTDQMLINSNNSKQRATALWEV